MPTLTPLLSPSAGPTSRGAVGLALVGAVALGLLAALGPAVAVVLVLLLAGATAVLLLRRFDLLLHLLVLSVFIESVGVGPVRVGRLLAVVAAIAIVGRLVFTSWRPRRFRPGLAVWPAGLFAVWAWSSGLWAQNTGAWAFALAQLGLAAAYFAAFTLFVERREQIRALLRTYVGGALFAAAAAFVQVAAGADRAEGLQGDANIYAMYQVAALPAAAMLATTAAPGRRWVGYAAIPVILASVLATQSRGGLATAVAVLLLLFVRGDLGEGLRRHRAAAIAGGISIGVALVAVTMTFSRRFAPDRVIDDRASGRFDIWYVAFREWQDHLLLGIGGGNFKPRSVELLVTEPGVELVKSHLLLSEGIEVHNIYLETLVEYGLMGAALFVAVLVLTGAQLWAAARATADPVVRALPMMLVAFLAASFFLSVVNNKLLWFLVALGVVLGGRPPLPAERADAASPAPTANDLGHRLRLTPRPLVVSVLVLALAASAVAAGATALAPQRWVSSVPFVVSSSGGPAERETIVRTLASLVTSSAVTVDIGQRTGVNLSPREIAGRISVTRPPGTLTFSAQVVDGDRERSARLARGLLQAFSARVDALRTGAASEEGPRFSLLPWGGSTIMTTQLSRPVLVHGLLGLALGLTVAALLLVVRVGSDDRTPNSEFRLASTAQRGRHKYSRSTPALSPQRSLSPGCGENLSGCT